MSCSPGWPDKTERRKGRPFAGGKRYVRRLGGDPLSNIVVRTGFDLPGIPVDLEDAERRDLEAIMSRRRLDRGQMLLTEGDEPRYTYGVLGGGLKLVKCLRDGRTQMTGYLLPGDSLGLPIYGGYPYSAEALADTVVCQFPTTALMALFKRHPRLQFQLLEITCGELSLAQEHMLLLGRKTMTERVCTFLVGLLERIERWGGHVDSFRIPLRRGEIADYLGVTIETVSRTFSRLQRDGLIAIEHGNGVKILDRPKLAAMAIGR